MGTNPNPAVAAARRATKAAEEAIAKRNGAIRAASTDGGASMRALAEATGLSTTRIHQIVHEAA